ncbi:MAG: alanine--tRNA ligase, partial [Flavobacteriales bacterium]|nr:alanine--tRNA ligase [Flavobacteriales bacterium]
DTDVFMPVIRRIEQLSGKKYDGGASEGQQEKTDIAMRVIADHIRAISFSIADGQLPSNNGAGYVIRRILRRAIRYGYQSLELREPFFHSLVAVLANQMGDFFPEIRSQRELVEKVIREEEIAFYRTLENGIRRIESVCEQVKNSAQKMIDGTTVFELYDTFGFPVDLTSLIARGHGLSIDAKGFEVELNKQKDRSRAATNVETDDWMKLREDDTEEFIGYDQTEAEVVLVKYRKVKAKGKEMFQLVFDKTPFYPEGGGQVGDTGYIESAQGKVAITDTRKENNLIVHFADQLPADTSVKFNAVVEKSKRRDSARNHSATHLLHEALRSVLGTHVEQKGSLVNPDYLRFDFSHFSKMTEEEIRRVEQMVNEKIRENISLDERRDTPIDDAKNMGAMALFGEKYGDKVRVIKFGTSVELCGGTHVRSTGEIGFFKIVSESAVAAGIRRVEAITGVKADEYFRSQEVLIEQVAELLKRPKDITKAIQDLLSQNAELNKQLEVFAREKAVLVKDELLKDIKEINGVRFIAKKVDLDAANIKDISFQLKSQIENLFLVLGSESGGKASISVAISDALINDRKLNAGTIVRELAKAINGGGGGQAFFATAGGTNAQGIAEALKKAESYL